MLPSITPPRFAHSEGYTTVAFGHTGQFVCTGGSDSLVRIFHAPKGERDQEAITLEHHTDNVLSLAVSKNKILSGDEEGVILSFDVSSRDPLSIEPSGSVLRSALSARDLSISSSERQVAVAADDEVVRIVSLLDMSLLHSLQGHRAPVTSVSFSPDSVFLASVGCDGSLRVWDMRDDPACVHIDNKITYVCEPGNSMAQTKARWSPDGRLLAVPCNDNGIRLIERNTWEVLASLAGVHTKQVTCLAWSGNGRYVASVALDNKAVVWDVQARKAIDWNPTGNMLAFTDNTGAMYIWDDVVAIDQGHAAPYNKIAMESSSLAGSLKTQARISEPDSKLMSDLFGDAAAVDEMIEEAEMEEDAEILEQGEDTNDMLDDFVVDDDGAGYAEPKAQPWAVLADQQTRSFQPGATPWINSRRYLAFNMVGSVAAVAQDSSYNTIELEFYDKSLRRDFHFSDTYKFSMAALSENGCLFATTSRELANDQSLRELAGSDDEVSVLSYRAFASWSTNTDWLFKLPENEHPRCIAASSHGVAAITSQGMLRCFTLGGAQRHIESLPDRTVTCVANKDMLLIILESAGSIRTASGEKRMEYEYILMTIDGQTRLAAGACPVTPRGEIVWAGFSEEGHPATCDSKGNVRLLHKYWDASDAAWVPVLDTRALAAANGKKEAYWPVAISAKQFMVVTCPQPRKIPATSETHPGRIGHQHSAAADRHADWAARSTAV
ncbi:WD40 repeat-like protein [Linderina pennispora]|uniref:WD40 repeat-like protein n=1 Tax=Linderina pennispora TaxID=61395 RepID=A0A1Y1W2T4_9FUNG|nr:WD40 repeat-like protein [Linderina pennispora]ORX67586.1 WD40 repeat-like protein [Linderina pennispora]